VAGVPAGQGQASAGKSASACRNHPLADFFQPAWTVRSPAGTPATRCRPRRHFEDSA